MSTNILSNTFTNANNLFLEIEQIAQLDLSVAVQNSARLFAVKSEADQFFKLDAASFIQNNGHELLATIAACQSKLFKKLSPEWKNSKQFADCIVKAWQSAHQASPPSTDLLIQSSMKCPKDPIVLVALREHLTNTLLEQFVDAYQEKDFDKAFALLQALPTPDRLIFEKTVSETDPSCIETSIKKAEIDPKIIEAASKCIQTNKFHHAYPFPPLLHHRINPVSFLLFEDAENNIAYIKTMHKTLIANHSHTLTGRERYRDLILRNLTHPIIEEVSFKNAKEQLQVLKDTMLSGKSQEANKIYSSISNFAQSILLSECLKVYAKQNNIENPPVEIIEKLIAFDFIDGKLSPCILEGLDNAIAFSKKAEEKSSQEALKSPLDLRSDPFMEVMTITEMPLYTNQVLETNLSLALEAITFVRRKIAVSMNFYNREDAFFDTLPANKTKNTDIIRQLGDCRKKKMHEEKEKLVLKKSTNDDAFARMYAVYKNSECFPFGNCYELACNVFFHLLDKTDQNIEVVEIDSGMEDADHVLVILGRTPSSDLDRPETWGKNAIVCDPWARKIYPGSLLHTVLNDYTQKVLDGFPILKKFNPQNQFLLIKTQNIMTTDVFMNHCKLEKRKTDIDFSGKIPVELGIFHSTDDKNKKSQFAENILNLLGPKEVGHPISTLRSQMLYFLKGKIPSKKTLLQSKN